MSPVRPLRVLMLARAVYPLHGYGGLERHVFHLTTHLLRQGVHVQLLAGHPPAAAASDPHAAILAAAGLDDSASHSALRVHTLRYDRTGPRLRPNSIVGRQINYPLFSLQEAILARQLVAAGTVDIIHTQGLCGWGISRLRRVDPGLAAVPWIANPHGLEEYRTPGWPKWLAYIPFRAFYGAAHRAADRVIATDAATRDDVPAYLGVDPAHVVVIPSAIDAAECLRAVDPDVGAELRLRWGLTAADPVLLSVGRLEQNKGFHVMLAALRELAPTLGSHWRWLLVGTGTAQASLQREATRLGLAEHVIFTGPLDDVGLHSLYEEVDLFVHPTLYEGSSLVTLEAMLHRLPIVASAAGGIPDKVFPHQNGLLVPPGDAPALAAALRTALQHRAAWPAWGEHGRATVLRTFNWPIVAARTRAEYEQMGAHRHA
ncbi:MAG: glycosyltransferase family 4 protein [Herpetosiphon sp.]